MMFEHDDGIRVTTRRARIVKVDDSESQQRVDIKGLKKEKPEKVWRPMDFGFTSNPPEDSDGVMVQMGSRSDRTLYFDGGHQKYRPKDLEPGDTALFDHNGDIIKVFKESIDVVHKELINIKIGKGYDAGGDGEGEGEGEGDDEGDETEISIVIKKGDSVTVTFDDSSVRLESGKISLKSVHVVVEADRVDLGEEGGQPVGLCSGGCATKVFAV